MSAVVLPFAAKPRRRACIAEASVLSGRVISFDAPHLRLALLWKRRPVVPSTLDELDMSRAADRPKPTDLKDFSRRFHVHAHDGEA